MNIKAIIFGQAIGDAVGAYTEFRSKKMIKKDFPTLEDFDFPPIKRNFMKRETNCDWTDDTDQLILLMEVLTECGKVDERVFAKKLVNWMDNGFPDLGDSKGYGCGGQTSKVLSDPDYLSNPIKTSEKYKISQANGSLMRTAILACQNKPFSEIIKDVEIASKVTHAHYLCVESCIEFVKLLQISKTNIGVIGPDDLESLTLDDTHSGHVLKTLEVIKWTYNNRFRDFKTVIKEIVLEGGDADTNAAVAGAILGAAQGMEGLPQDWLSKLPNKDWLNIKINEYLMSLDDK